MMYARSSLSFTNDDEHNPEDRLKLVHFVRFICEVLTSTVEFEGLLSRLRKVIEKMCREDENANFAKRMSCG